MPCRLIREGLICSERVNQLDANGERFFVRLMLKADDFGCFTANHALLKAALFPLRDDVRSTDIPRWLAACEKAGLVRCYSADGKEYVEVLNFDQRLRAKKRRYPPPPTHDGQMTGTCPTDDRHMPARREEEVEEEVESEEKKKTEGANGARPAGKVSDDEWLEGLKKDPTYQGIDVGREFGKMVNWCSVKGKEPSRRRFINWLNRAERPMNGATHLGTAKPNPRNVGIPPVDTARGLEIIRRQNAGH